MNRSEQVRQRNELARRAEALIAGRLADEGYRLLGRNVRIGPHELDIVALRGDTLVICEVRCRSDATWIHPAQTLTARKQAALRRGVAALLEHEPSLRGLSVRIDLAAVVLSGDDADVTYLEGAL